VKLTRAALYDLVWSKPRSTIAKELGVSDVWIGKECERSNIPAPPRGHWARVESGKPTSRPPLPMRRPGQTDTLGLGGQGTSRPLLEPEDLSDLPPAPTFSEDAEKQLECALRSIGRISACRDLSTPHVALRRVLASEARLRAKHDANRSWSFYKPRFDSPKQQRQLRLFNSLGMVCTTQFSYPS
jgi:hypothetical protein